jgi:hypothetical protein
VAQSGLNQNWKDKIMLGMEMMLKSMGLDPAQIKSGVEEFGQVIIDMKAQMNRIEHKLDAVLAQNLIEETALITEKD